MDNHVVAIVAGLQVVVEEALLQRGEATNAQLDDHEEHGGGLDRTWCSCTTCRLSFPETPDAAIRATEAHVDRAHFVDHSSVNHIR